MNLFQEKLRNAYIDSGVYLQKKFPLNNKLLLYLSAIDPKAQGNSVTYSALKKLKNFFLTVLSGNDDETEYLKEISKLQCDPSLPDADKFERLDHWWHVIFQEAKYPSLSKVIKAAISIFTGPSVEQSFSVLNHILTPKTNRMKLIPLQIWQFCSY